MVAVPATPPPFVSRVERVTAADLPYSWHRGCPVGPAQLRRVRLRYMGFDGSPHSGQLVVNASVVHDVVVVFRTLYLARFPIRQMKPIDVFHGSDDRSAAADNTSAFNCRYVGGQEASKVYSKHAYGTAIDVNDFENPYVDDNGVVYPDTYFLKRRVPAPGVFSGSGSAAVRAFTSQGLRWGGRWSPPDYQHFDR